MTEMTRKERKRRSEIIEELSRLSRDGWRYATSDDYRTLEAELRAGAMAPNVEPDARDDGGPEDELGIVAHGEGALSG